MNQNEIHLRVLHLEDSARDHELIREMLEEENIHCEFCCVKNRQDFEAHLEREEFDLILPDFAMPGYDGLSALGTAHDTKPETPFIFVSGTIGEERAAESLKNGATDYVIKGNLHRLAPAVMRALREAKERAERGKAETALRESEKRYRTLFEAMDEGFSVVEMMYDPDGAPIDYRYLEINPAFEKQTGFQQAVGRTIREIVPDLEAHWIEFFGNVARTGESRRVENPVDAMQKFYDVFAFRIGGEGSRKVGILFNDITTRKRAEERMRESETLYHSLVENLPQCIFRKDLAGRFTFANRRFCEFIGKSLPDLLGKTDGDLFPRELAERYQADDRRIVETGAPFESVEEIEITAGARRFIQTVKTPLRGLDERVIGVQGIFWDVTERKNLEAQSLRGQRLESLGTLAGGIAHDLNNMLAPIMMSIEILRLKYSDAGAEQILTTIEASAQRGAEMVKQVLTFARGVQGERVTLQVAHIIKEIGKILKQTFPKAIESRIAVANQLWPTVGDATQLQQVLMNLCVNARDAMPDGGTLKLEASNFVIDESFAVMDVEAKPGPYVMISVKDTGTGIPAQVLERMFEPFFTTKPLDKGTGLGLSTVRGIVKTHGGFIKVHTEIGRGTEFQVFLPAQKTTGPSQVQAQPCALPTGHGEVVLVVDDEAAVLNIAKQTLETFGYHVLTANDGAEAIGLCAQPGSVIKLMVTDMMMPILDGPSTINGVRRVAPTIKIIATSGADGRPDLTGPNRLKIDAVLQKPYSAEQLLKMVHRVLSGEEVPGSKQIGETTRSLVLT